MTTTTDTTPTVDLAAVKERQQRTWSSGDYGAVGATLQIISEELCEAAELRPGWRVLDVATGNGGTAIAAARRGCDVTGVDYVPALLAQARDRAAAERFAITFDDGDAENLPYDDASFDAVTSTLGVMFTADHQRTADELLRVCRPGGRIALANWTPDGFIGQVFKTIGAHVPPPPGVTSPAMWGTDGYLRTLFGDGITELPHEHPPVHVPVPVGRALPRLHAHVLRPDAQGLREPRRPRPRVVGDRPAHADDRVERRRRHAGHPVRLPGGGGDPSPLSWIG